MASENDKAVLNCIFNPLLPAGEVNYEEELPENLKDDEELTEVVTKVKDIEVKGVEAAEKGDLNTALKLFSEVIEMVPLRASGFNNRAQVLRLLSRDNAALEDLNKAIELSSGKGRSGCQALCQRGLLYRKKGDTDSARNDFTKAADLGSQFAKQQLVEINPYAAMCNQMLHQVISKLYGQDPVQNGT